MAKNIILIFLSISLLDMVFAQSALAYLDPGTGSYIFQLLIAAGLAAAYTLKVYWFKVVAGIKSIFRRPEKDKKDHD